MVMEFTFALEFTFSSQLQQDRKHLKKYSYFLHGNVPLVIFYSVAAF